MKKFILILITLGLIYSPAYASITTTPYVTADDVTVENLESNRVVLTDATNSADGGLLQAGSVPAAKLDDNANPENRWNEAFNDFVFSGLTIPTSASLLSTTASGTAYVNGVRVVKDATAHTYTASKWTWVDLSSTGVYTYSEVAISGSEPSTATNSMRLARVSTDSTTVLSVSDERVTEINIAAGSAGSIADTDADTGIQTEESTDEDILRFDLGDTTLGAAAEVLTLQAIDGTYVKMEPGSDDNLDLGSTTKKFRNAYIDGTISADDIVPGVSQTVGDIFYADSENKLARLAPGTSGYLLTAQGSATAPAYAAEVGTSAVLFQYSAQVTAQGTELGEVVGTTLVPDNQTGNYRFIQGTDTSFTTVWVTKWIKIASVSTITIHAQIWQQAAGAGSGNQARLQVSVGGQTGDVTGTDVRQTPEWVEIASIDVSSLTNGTLYDVLVQLRTVAGVEVYLGSLIAFGS